MTSAIRLSEAPIRPVLPLLLEDRTTGRNIIWATGSYAHLGPEYAPEAPLTPAALMALDAALQPRALKALSEQQQRTKAHAEVFTPAWIVNAMNNHCDEAWFGRGDVFNAAEGRDWRPVEAPVALPPGKSWRDYVDSRRLEITCGEAPFIASRYDAATGEPIPIPRRVGALDRKLRLVSENAGDEAEWLRYCLRAFESVYGYEYQGDNLLIARVNLLMTFAEYLHNRWGRAPTDAELRQVADVIAWNFWQMDGLTGTVPLCEPEPEHSQLSMLDLLGLPPENAPRTAPRCKIYDWQADAPLLYEEVGRERAV